MGGLELPRLREICSWFHLGYDFVHFNIISCLLLGRMLYIILCLPAIPAFEQGWYLFACGTCLGGSMLLPCLCGTCLGGRTLLPCLYWYLPWRKDVVDMFICGTCFGGSMLLTCLYWYLLWRKDVVDMFILVLALEEGCC